MRVLEILMLSRAVAPFTIGTTGPTALSTALAAALDAQWTLGFPRTPDGVDQLTHGFYRYPAALNPIAASHLLSVVPDDGPLLDPFCGSGTALIEGLRSGRETVIGADASPLALWVAARHTWRPAPAQCERLRALASAAAASATADGSSAITFDRLREELEAVAQEETDEAVCEALWFCFCVSQQRAATQRKLAKDPAATLVAVTSEYAHCAARLASAVGGGDGGGGLGAAAVEFVSSDARQLTLPRRASAIVTSPPYPGVYDYLSLAREGRALHGRAPVMGLRQLPEEVPGERVRWPEDWRSDREIGARKARRRRPQAFASAWDSDQKAWMSAALGCLVSGGRAALLIGDGDGLDNLAATSRTAAEVGFELLATATISSDVERTERKKGQRRTEHALLLEVP